MTWKRIFANLEGIVWKGKYMWILSDWRNRRSKRMKRVWIRVERICCLLHAKIGMMCLLLMIVIYVEKQRCIHGKKLWRDGFWWDVKYPLTSFVQPSSRVHVPPLELLHGICEPLCNIVGKTLENIIKNLS